MNRFAPLVFLFVMITHASLVNGEKANEVNGASSRSLISELNFARQNPARYATLVEALRERMNGNLIVLPGGARIRTKEGTAALDEAIRFLRTAQPQSPLTLSPGICRAAADHCADQADGGFGHRGRDASNALKRISRYGTCGGSWGENISYGKSTARAVILALIIDDGLPARKHRKNIFNPAFSFAGAAFGRHAKFGTMCSMEFAGGYVEHGQSKVQSLVAGNL